MYNSYKEISSLYLIYGLDPKIILPIVCFSRKQQIITTEGQSTNDTVEEVEKLRIKHRVSIEHISPYKESYTVNSHWKIWKWCYEWRLRMCEISKSKIVHVVSLFSH